MWQMLLLQKTQAAPSPERDTMGSTGGEAGVQRVSGKSFSYENTRAQTRISEALCTKGQVTNHTQDLHS